MDFKVNLTKRTRRRKLLGGEVVLQDRWILNYRDPKTGARRQIFFAKKRDAEARQRELLTQVAEGAYVDPKAVPTVAEAVDHWLADKDGKVKASTLKATRSSPIASAVLCSSGPGRSAPTTP